MWLPVLLADDVRHFMFGWKSREDGGTGEHPLLSGVRLTKSKGREVRWLTEDGGPPGCDAPGCGKPSVAARFMDRGITAMVCGDHVERSGA